MIYFLEHDTDGNITYVASRTDITIVPLVNTVTFAAKGNPLKNAQGQDLSVNGYPLAEPVGIDQTTFNTLITDGIDKYTFDSTTGKIVAKVATDGK